MDKTVTRAEVHFSGRVQGVGFRYATLQVAKEFAVTGEVKNLSDGRVFLVAEGEKAEVDAFLGELQERMSPFIRETDGKFLQVTPSCQNFAITR